MTALDPAVFLYLIVDATVFWSLLFVAIVFICFLIAMLRSAWK